MSDDAKSNENESVTGKLEDFKKLAEQYNQGHAHISQQVCPQCGYCPCCGRPRGNFNYPTYPTWPYYPGPYYQGPTCGSGHTT